MPAHAGSAPPGRAPQRPGDRRAPGDRLSVDGVDGDHRKHASGPCARVAAASDGAGNAGRDPSGDGIAVERTSR